jgi:outer membrane lipoprotein-sorting protein
MKTIFISVAILVASIGTVSAQSADEIVAKNLNAIGGVAKLQEVKSVIMENSIKVQGLDIENQTTILVGKAIRSDSKIMGNNMVQAFDGNTPWAITPIMMGGNGEPQTMSEEASKSIIAQMDPFPLLDYAKKGTSIALLGSEKVKGKDAHHLKISPTKGAGSEIWIDVSSGLLSKLKTVQNGQEVEVFFSNYSSIEGINFSMSMETSSPMGGIITIDTRTVKLNSSIDKQIFTMPIKNN